MSRVTHYPPILWSEFEGLVREAVEEGYGECVHRTDASSTPMEELCSRCVQLAVRSLFYAIDDHEEQLDTSTFSEQSEIRQRYLELRIAREAEHWGPR